MTFVIGKLNLCHISLYLGVSLPLEQRRPLEYEMSLHTYTTYIKGILSLGGGGIIKDKHAI